jgi:transposase-like protein
MHSRKRQISNSTDARPDPEVVPTAKRRSFSKAEKLRILAAADACVAPGDIGALLRREGIYSSHVVTWRKQRQLAGEAQLVEGKRGPKVKPGAGAGSPGSSIAGRGLVSSIARPLPSMPNCSMRDAISPRRARCTACCKAVPLCANAAINCAIRGMPSRSCWR